jgi:uncharacterized protein (TIGR02147 family)
MAPLGMERKIFEYLDYRQYLTDYYQFKKQASSAFSLRSFSDRIGFKTKDFILRVMKGDKNLSAQSIPMVAQALKFGKRESEFFEALVHFNQAGSTAERDKHFAHLQTALKAARFTDKQHLLALHQYQAYSNWHHLAVRSLIGLHGFSGDYAALAARVHPRITTEEAQKSVALLEHSGLIAADAKGHYQLTRSAITTGDRVNKAALQGFHQHCLRLAAASIDSDPGNKRNISGLTLGISEKGYARIVERLNAFRKEVAQIADEDDSADRVYQMQFLLFPLSE